MGDDKEGLLNEEGMLEVDQGGLFAGAVSLHGWPLITWRKCSPYRSWNKGIYRFPRLSGDTSHCCSGSRLCHGRPGTSTLYARYLLSNTSRERQHVSLFLPCVPSRSILPGNRSISSSAGASDRIAIWPTRGREQVRVNRQKWY